MTNRLTVETVTIALEGVVMPGRGMMAVELAQPRLKFAVVKEDGDDVGIVALFDSEAEAVLACDRMGKEIAVDAAQQQGTVISLGMREVTITKCIIRDGERQDVASCGNVEGYAVDTVLNGVISSTRVFNHKASADEYYREMKLRHQRHPDNVAQIGLATRPH